MRPQLRACQRRSTSKNPNSSAVPSRLASACSPALLSTAQQSGGLFALVFALAYGRIGDLSPRATAALLALLGFVSVYLAPVLKYPANPPSVGLPDTIGMRTSLYFSMLLISLGAMIAAGLLRGSLNKRLGEWNATLIAAGAYIVVVVGVALALPDVNEVPEGFPASCCGTSASRRSARRQSPGRLSACFSASSPSV